MSDNTFYSEFVRDMFKRRPDDHGHFLRTFGQLHAAAGIAGEAGEILEIFKKYAFTNKPINRAELISELGDIEFYLQALRTVTNITRDEVLKANIKKLEGRHPDGFKNSDYYQESK